MGDYDVNKYGGITVSQTKLTRELIDAHGGEVSAFVDYDVSPSWLLILKVILKNGTLT